MKIYHQCQSQQSCLRKQQSPATSLRHPQYEKNSQQWYEIIEEEVSSKEIRKAQVRTAKTPNNPSELMLQP